MTALHTVRVTAIRKQNPRGFGGAIFTAKPLDSSGSISDATRYFVVRASSAVLNGVTVERGQWWRVGGAMTSRICEIDGYSFSELQLEAVHAEMVRPSGEHIINYIADNPEFVGIGEVKARRLWDTFGDRLYEILDSANVAALSSVVATEAAQVAVEAWSRHGQTHTLQWLQSHGFDVSLGRKVVEFFGSEAPQRIAEDPYRLLSFCASWRQVDDIARNTFGLADDDKRRLLGAVEEACYRSLGLGHTAMPIAHLLSETTAVLGESGAVPRMLLAVALEHAESNHNYVQYQRLVQPLGAAAMEGFVARAIADRVQPRVRPLMSASSIDACLNDFEVAESIRLNHEQRLAVRLACENAFACITGGAGVGKTTVLKALYAVLDTAGVPVLQVALAGRAAKRMQEATGRPASTIATFLRTFRDDEALEQATVLVVDEASMVDIIAMSQLCELVPSHFRLLLVGDPHQLMPVGPGLVLHDAVGLQSIPVVELVEVKRYGNDIARAASAVRDGTWPRLGASSADPIAFLECGAASIAETAFELYAIDRDNTKILSARRDGAGGVKGLNALCQARLTVGSNKLTVWNHEHQCVEYTGLNLGDVVLCTRNMWDRGLQNGSLGTIVELASSSTVAPEVSDTAADEVLAWIDWDDGVRRPLSEDMLDDIELGYAITVHKAQGSQWPRVIVPVTPTRLLDRTLLYTAITRAQRQVLLIGDADAARSAVESLPRAHRRITALGSRIAACLEAAKPAPSPQLELPVL